MQLPPELRSAIQQATASVTGSSLAKAAAHLSEQYHGPKPPQLDHDLRLAYLTVRLPATYSVARRVFAETASLLQLPSTPSLLDLGAGPGTAFWAATGVLSELSRYTAYDRDRGFLELSRVLIGPTPVPLEIHPADLTQLRNLDPHDLTLLSYVFNEVPIAARPFLLKLAWAHSRQALILIEPGTPTGYRNILDARDQLLALGAHIVAPCPHQAACPMSTPDWCHFSVRVERTREHKQAKGGALGYEDEKYSYLVAARAPATHSSRILRHPTVNSGFIQLSLCTAGGLEKITVTKRDKAAFRAARKALWGDAWNPQPSA